MSKLVTYYVAFWFRGNGDRGRLEVAASSALEAAKGATEHFHLRGNETLEDMLIIVYAGRRAAGVKFHVDGVKVLEGGGRWGR